MVVSGEKGPISAIRFKKTILRYCMITWALMMRKISPVIEEIYFENDSPDKLIEMGLITPEEFEKLSENDGTSVIWSDKWWMPMTWNMLMVNDEMNEKGHIPMYLIFSPESNLVKFEVPLTLTTDSKSAWHAYFKFGMG